jgi:hypothetical protein
MTSKTLNRYNSTTPYNIRTNFVPVAKKDNLKIGNINFIIVFYKVTYIHIHYIIYTFSVVGSIPTPLNDHLDLPDGPKGDFGE